MLAASLGLAGDAVDPDICDAVTSSVQLDYVITLVVVLLASVTVACQSWRWCWAADVFSGDLELVAVVS